MLIMCIILGRFHNWQHVRYKYGNNADYQCMSIAKQIGFVIMRGKNIGSMHLISRHKSLCASLFTAFGALASHLNAAFFEQLKIAALFREVLIQLERVEACYGTTRHAQLWPNLCKHAKGFATLVLRQR